MELNLKKDIVFFDIESTGLSTSQDRIVQLAIIKYFDCFCLIESHNHHMIIGETIILNKVSNNFP